MAVIDIVKTGDIVTATDDFGHTYTGGIVACGPWRDGQIHPRTDAGGGPLVYMLEFSFVQAGRRFYSSVNVREEHITSVVRNGKRIYWRGHRIRWS